MKTTFTSTERGDALQQLEACLEQLRRHALNSLTGYVVESELTKDGGSVSISFPVADTGQPYFAGHAATDLETETEKLLE